MSAQSTAAPLVVEPERAERLHRATKDIMFGSFAGMISKIIEHPFDLVKVRLQTQPHDAPHYTGALDCFQKTIRYEGVRGLFRGVSMPLWGATLEDAALFLTYNQVQSALCWAHGYRDASSLAMSDLAIAAAASGAMAGLVLTPVELIKCKMQVQRMGASSTLPPPNATTLISETVRQSGVLGLWHGLSGTLLREVGGGVAWFLTFEVATRKFLQWRQQSTPDKLLTKSDLGSLELATSGAMAGVLYNVSLFPADSVKSTMQTEQELLAHAGKAPSTPSGFWTTFRRIYATRGLRGLYAGVGVTCLRSAPSSALVFLVYNKLEQAAEAYGL